MSATRLREVTLSSSEGPASAELRRHPRFSISYRLLIRWLECDDCHEELIRAEDVSRSGARLVVRSPIAEGEVVFVQGWDGDGFEARAEVRRVYVGHDGQTRLGVAFIDAEVPEQVLARVRPA
jgi:PilZ domain